MVNSTSGLRPEPEAAVPRDPVVRKPHSSSLTLQNLQLCRAPPSPPPPRLSLSQQQLEKATTTAEGKVKIHPSFPTSFLLGLTEGSRNSVTVVLLHVTSHQPGSSVCRAQPLTHQGSSGDRLWSPSWLESALRAEINTEQRDLGGPLCALLFRGLSFSLLNLRARTASVPGCGSGGSHPPPGQRRQMSLEDWL